MTSLFFAALVSLLSVEGGLTDDSDDPGGLTYAGISRNYHPEWSGFDIIDAERKRGGNYRWRLYNNAILNGQVQAFYWQTVWQPLRLDLVPSEKIRVKMFGIGVHIGNYYAVRAVQGAMCMEKDGYIGPVTLAAISNSVRRGKVDVVMQGLDAYQNYIYNKQIKANPVKEKYRTGWDKRIREGL